jgi:hypothetical protein
VIGDHTEDRFEHDSWSGGPEGGDEVEAAIRAFSVLVPVGTADAELARLAVAAIVWSLSDASGPDAPTLGMMGVPVLIEDPLARAALADASPSARETLGDLEREIVRRGPTASARSAERIRLSIRNANARLAHDPPSPRRPGTPDGRHNDGRPRGTDAL